MALSSSTRFGILLSFSVAAASLAVVPAFGQSTGLTRGQVDLQERLPTEGPPKLSDQAPVISEVREQDQAAGVEVFSFLLNGVNIINATVYDTDDFAPLYEEFVGGEVTLGGLREIADRIETLYRDDGYVATRAILPPQAITDGVPLIEVYEGRVVYYEINGEIGPVKKQIARLLDNLITGEPARWSELERYLLLARDLPGVSLTGTLRSAGDTVPGGVILVVDTARKAVDGFVNLQNLSPKSAGRDTLSGGIASNSTGEFGERLGFVALGTVLDPLEQLSGFMSYQQNLGGDGLVVRLSGTQSRSEPGAELEPADIVINNTLINFHLEYPLVRSRDFSLWTRGGFEYIDQDSTTAGNEIFDDQVRVLFAGLRGVWRPWGGGLTLFDIEVRKGLRTFGASRSVGIRRSRPDAVPNFLIYRASADHLQPLGDFFSIDIRVQGQWSELPLTSIEEMALGELTVGRGFEAGVITGESGFGVAAEVRYSHPGFTNETTAEYIDRVEFYAFYDYARVYDQGAGFGAKFEDVSSVGLGVRIQLIKTLFADFYYVHPLQPGLSIDNEAPPGSVRFNLTMFF